MKFISVSLRLAPFAAVAALVLAAGCTNNSTASNVPKKPIPLAPVGVNSTGHRRSGRRVGGYARGGHGCHGRGRRTPRRTQRRVTGDLRARQHPQRAGSSLVRRSSRTVRSTGSPGALVGCVSPARIGKSAPILRLVTFSLPFLLRLASSRLARETSCRTPGALVFDKRTVKLGKAGVVLGWMARVGADCRGPSRRNHGGRRGQAT